MMSRSTRWFSPKPPSSPAQQTAKTGTCSTLTDPSGLRDLEVVDEPRAVLLDHRDLDPVLHEVPLPRPCTVGQRVDEDQRLDLVGAPGQHRDRAYVGLLAALLTQGTV